MKAGRRVIWAAALLPTLFLGGCNHRAEAGAGDVWDRAYDAKTGTRFIPVQLIIGGSWDGNRTLSWPSGVFAEAIDHGSIWNGPQSWTNPDTGRTLIVYERSRTTKGGVEQRFAIRDDGAAIGRVSDSRFGISSCDQEAKYPLGLWRQGETRTFQYTCWYGGKPRGKVTIVTIRELDFEYQGWSHALRVEWTLRDQGGSSDIDHKIYTFLPGKSVVRIE